MLAMFVVCCLYTSFAVSFATAAPLPLYYFWNSYTRQVCAKINDSAVSKILCFQVPALLTTMILVVILPFDYFGE